MSAGHRGIEPRSQGCCRMCFAMCECRKWLSLFAGRPSAAAGGLPLYGIIPDGSYLTLNPYDRKNMMTFLVFHREL